jgi:hypothetical protein
MKLQIWLVVLLLMAVAVTPVGFAQTCYTCNHEYENGYIVAAFCGDAPYDQTTTGFTDCTAYSGVWSTCIMSGGACMAYYPPGGGTHGGGDTANGDPADYGTSPIMIKTSNGPWVFGTTPDVAFDFDGDGKPEHVTWTPVGTDIGFLVLDHNQNGVIDWNDIYGNYGHQDGPNGFDYLAQLDLNKDGVIDAQDKVFPYLGVWIDANRDGKSAPGEVRPLEAFGITALYLDYNMTRREDRAGNNFRYRTNLVRNGHVEPYYDVYFATTK